MKLARVISPGLSSGCYRPLSRSGGFTLIEALLGFLILSIGMLGIASLQAVSLKAGKTSVYGSVAALKVEELFENIRANPDAISSYTGDGVSNNCYSSNCNSVELAENDVYLWKQGLTAGLPATADTTTEVTVIDPAVPSKMATVTITVSWEERSKDSETGVSKSFSSTSNICTANPC